MLVTMGMHVPGFGWGGAHLKCKDPECNRKCGCCDEEMTQDVMSAVAAERVEFGNPTGMAGSVPGEMELPAQRGLPTRCRREATWEVRPASGGRCGPARWWWCVARWASWFPSTAKRAP